MSEQNVEVVRAIYERFGEGDFRASVDLLDPHIVLLMLRDSPMAEAYVGLEGVATATRELLDTWADLTVEAEEFIPAGDSVLVSPSARRRADQRRSD